MIPDYDAACVAAATRQGLDPIAQVMSEEGVHFAIEQTGGFVMCLTVTAPTGTYAFTDDGEIFEGFYAGDSWTEHGEPTNEKSFTSLDELRLEAKLLAWMQDTD